VTEREEIEGVCVCVCEREIEREGDRRSVCVCVRERDSGGREGERERVSEIIFHFLFETLPFPGNSAECALEDTLVESDFDDSQMTKRHFDTNVISQLSV